MFGPVYDAERFGARLVASPRHADALMVTGPVTKNMAVPLRQDARGDPCPEAGHRPRGLRAELRRVPRRLRRRRRGRRRRPRRRRGAGLPAGARDDSAGAAAVSPASDGRRRGSRGRHRGRGWRWSPPWCCLAVGVPSRWVCSPLCRRRAVWSPRSRCSPVGSGGAPAFLICCRSAGSASNSIRSARSSWSPPHWSRYLPRSTGSATPARGLDSRVVQATYPLFVWSLLFVPVAASVSTFLLLWELMAVTSLLLVLAEHRHNPAARRRPVVRGDDAVRPGRHLDRLRVVRRPRRRRIVRGVAGRRAGCPPRWRVNGLRARAGRVRLESGRRAAARVAAPRASRGTEPRVGADVGGDGQARGLRDPAGGLGSARRRAPLVGGDRARPSARCRPCSGSSTPWWPATSSGCWPTRPPRTSG